MILEHVWGPHYGTENHYLRVYSYRLRRKLGDPDGHFLRTLPGVGYELVDDVPDRASPDQTVRWLTMRPGSPVYAPVGQTGDVAVLSDTA